MPDRPLEHWLAGQTRRAQRHPWVGLALIGAACLAAWFGIAKLQVGGIGDVFDAQTHGAQRYQAYSETFDNAGEVVVLIDTGALGEFTERAEAATHALGESLRETSAVQNVVWGLDRDTVSPKMLLTLPTPRVAEQIESLSQVKPLLVSETPAALLRAGMAEAVAQAAASKTSSLANPENAGTSSSFAEGAQLFEGLMQVLTRRLNTPADEPVDVFAAMNESLGQDPWQFMRTANGRLLVVRANLREGVDGDPGYTGALTAVRRHIEAIRQRFEDVPLGLTGLEPTRSEAQATIRTAAQRGVGAALAALWVLTALAWRDVRRPIVVTAAAGVAVWLLLGWSGAVVGVIHPVAGVGVLAGVGLSLFAALGWCSASLRRRADEAAVAVGPAVVVAAAAWGLAGLVVALNPWTETPGLRDAGWVGVGSCIVAIAVVTWVLPILLVLLRVTLPAETPMDAPPRREDLASALGNWAQRSRRGAWIVAGVILITVGFGAWRAEVSDNMTDYLPSKSEGAEWQRRAVEDGGERGLAAAIVADDLAHATRLTEQLRALPEVGRITGIARMVPEDMVGKREQLKLLDQTLGDAARRAATAAANSTAAVPQTNDDLLLQVSTARMGLSLAESSLPEAQRPFVEKMDRAAAEFIAAATALEPEVLEKRLAALQNDYTACRRHVGGLLQALLEDRDLKLEDLREATPLFSPWIATARADADTPPKLTLKIYPATAAGGWPSGEELNRFLAAVRRVAPETTGELERFAHGTSTLRRDLLRSSLALVLIAGLGLAALARSWRVGGAGVLVLGASWLAMAATIGWLGGVVGVVAGVVWPLAAVLVLAWLSQLAAATRRDNRHGDPDPAGADAFGLTLAVGFVLAAGLRGAQAPGLTAVAIGGCIGIAAAGLLGLLLIQTPGRSRTRTKPAAATS